MGSNDVVVGIPVMVVKCAIGATLRWLSIQIRNDGH
jgi:hypothetical protein